MSSYIFTHRDIYIGTVADESGTTIGAHTYTLSELAVFN
jgi:hypothetical protein